MATAVDPKVKEETLEMIRRWPEADQRELAAQLLGHAANGKGSAAPAAPRDRSGVLRLIGAWKDIQPTPTDEDIERILDEHRTRKSG